MDTLAKHKTTLIGIAVIAALFAVYWFFFRSPVPNEVLVGGNGAALAPDDAAISSELVALLDTLQGITFDTSVLSSPSFRSLVDFTEPLSPEPVGRSNPFAPLAP